MSEITHDVFISYARRDGLKYAERLDSELARTGLRTWRDKRNLDPAQDFTSELEKAIEQAKQVAVCLTPDTKRDESFVRREIGYALALRKPIVPLLFDDLVPPINIINLTFVDFFRQAWDNAFGELLKRLNQSPTSYSPPSQPTDPYREYLNTLYQQIVNYLDKTVFSLISLNTEATPDAVESPEESPASALPMAFFDVMREDDPNDEQDTFADFPAAFDKYRGRVLLLGEPGGGKTTTLMAFARDVVAKRLADPNRLLPLVAPIATWDAHKAPSIAGWLGEQIRALKTEDIARVISNGDALLILDALDELGSEREDPETKERFDPRLRFIEKIPVNNQLLITCRVKDYADIGQKIPLNCAVTLQPLNDEQMRAYLAKQPDLLAAIEADSGLREMSRTPLILSLFRFAYSGLGDEASQLRDLTHSPGDLRDKIFETYIKRRYERELRRPNSNVPYSLDQINQVLGQLAMQNAALGTTRNVFTVRHFKKFMDTENTNRFIDLARQLHLLVDGQQGTLQFIHLLIRDYFVFRYSISVLFDANAGVRDNAIRALGRIRDIRAVEPLIQTLFDTDEGIRINAIRVLTDIGGINVVEPLIEILSTSEGWVQSCAAEALGKIRDVRAIDPLRKALSSSDEGTRANAAEALGNFADDRVLDDLSHLLQDRTVISNFPRERVCDIAAKALKKIGTPEALAALEEWRRSLPDDKNQ